MKKTISLLGLMTLAVGACGDDGGGTTDPPEEDATQTGTLASFEDGFPEIAGTSATVRRIVTDDDPRLEGELTFAGGTEGNVYTFWWIIFNDDEACVSTPNDNGEPRCGFDDFTPAQVEATVQTFAYGFPGPEGGQVAPADGTITFPMRVYRTTDTEGGPGLMDVLGAEVHLLVRDHGPELATDDPNYDAQFTTYLGGCAPDNGPNECAEVAFVLFPDTTVAASDDGCTGHICP